MSAKGILYDLVMAPLERLGLRDRRRRLLAGVSGRVLEVGVGTGLNLPSYPADAWIVASDPQLSLLRRARRRRRPAQQLVCARAEALPFPDGGFDAVVGSFVFCTIADPARGLDEVGRVLAADGELRLFEHVRWSGYPWRVRLQDAFTPAWRLIADGCHLNRDTVALVESAGFRVIRRRDDLDGLIVELSARRRS